MTAEKGNKVYTISEAEKDTYQSQGYDIFEDGKVIAYGKGKTVPYEDYMKLQEENERLKEMIASSEEDASSESEEKTTVRKTVKSK
ncbi:hypothetical protein [Blautia obeum]|uniref:hypothetical protein n=1 Tax=Blautia obeum TaxID=40520 RepID=UPI0022E1F3B0|nr:hypothetical protein [Blautia obeum]